MANLISVVLVSKTHRGKRTLKVKSTHTNRRDAQVALVALYARSDAEYRILGPVQMKKLQAEIKTEEHARRVKGAQKAKKTIAENGGKTFICCPSCGAKSKKLFSEMGGLQTRKCAKGHTFEYDKWIADRAFWNPGAAVGNIFKKL